MNNISKYYIHIYLGGKQIARHQRTGREKAASYFLDITEKFPKELGYRVELSHAVSEEIISRRSSSRILDKKKKKEVIEELVSEKVQVLPLTKETGWEYYIDSDLNVVRSKMLWLRNGFKSHKPELIDETDLEKEKGYIYYLDSSDDISRAKI